MMLTSPELSRKTELYIPAIPFLHIQCIQRNQNQDLKDHTVQSILFMKKANRPYAYALPLCFQNFTLTFTISR